MTTERIKRQKTNLLPIPVDLLIHNIFLFLKGYEVARLTGACQDWNKAIKTKESDPILWKQLLEIQLLYIPKVQNSYFEYYKSKYLAGKQADKNKREGLQFGMQLVKNVSEDIPNLVIIQTEEETTLKEIKESHNINYDIQLYQLEK